MSRAVRIRPIRTEQDFDAAQKRIAALMDSKPGSPADDELDILLTLAEGYEKANYPVGSPDPIETVRFAMERLALSQADVVPYFGSKPRVSEFLHGKRPLTVETIRRLHEGLGIPAGHLLG